MEFKPKSGDKRVLFDAMKDGQNVAPKFVPPESEQEPNESRRLWLAVTNAIVSKDMEAATEAKTAVEDAQRELRRKREESGEQHVPRFFELRDGRWVPKLIVPNDPHAAIATVRHWIWSDTTPPPLQKPL